MVVVTESDILALLLVTSMVENIEALCGFGKVAYPDRYLRFPTTKIVVPPYADLGTRWRTPDGEFDCAVFGVDTSRSYVLEVTCCLIKSTDLKPWGEVKKRRLLSGIHQIFMEGALT